MIVILLVLGFGILGATEAWSLMLTIGIAHAHIMEAIHPISYVVSIQFVACTLPIQAVAGAFGLAGD